MCGIVGYLGCGTSRSASVGERLNSGTLVKEFDSFNDYILSGLKLLQNRGYDSVGVSSVINYTLETIKFASTDTHNSLDQLEQKITNLGLMNNNNDENNDTVAAIGHTRWATHGGKTSINAHPHHDNKDRIALVHNGIIENYHELKTLLIADGYTFRSQTDTEVVAVLIGKYLDLGISMENAVKNTIERLEGTWALVIIHKDFPNKLWVTRNGSPLLVGMEDQYVMIASEQIAFGNYVNKYIVLDNNDLIEITKTESTIQYNKNIQRYTINNKIHSVVELNPTKNEHWTLQEIMEQPESINRATSNGGRIDTDFCVKLGGLEAYKPRLIELNHLILLGCGTSYHAGLWALDMFKNMDIFDTVGIYDGAEFMVKDIPKRGKTGVILLSQSGETKDLHRCIQIAKENDLITIGVVNVIDSLIARETDCGVYLNAGREVAVASTKSFTNQCIVLSVIAIWFAQIHNKCAEKRKQMIKDMRNISFQVGTMLENTQTIHKIKSLATKMKTAKSMFLLGKGGNEAIAKEGALKLKEIAYIHAEGYSSSALKHGPFALIEPGLPIILFDLGENHRDKNRNAYQEVLARNAMVCRITDDNDYSRNSDVDNETDFIIEKNQTFGGVMANIVVQLLSYYLALELGYNPDFPRNLAKVVTVE